VARRSFFARPAMSAGPGAGPGLAPAMPPPTQHVDVVIVGAGLSGVGMACRLSTLCPRRTYVVLEARADVGGTWDLWKYPGVRTDSDPHTLAYPFRPWGRGAAVAQGSDICEYIRSTAAMCGVRDHIRTSHRVRSASYDSRDMLWTLDTIGGRFTCSFLHLCTGYYQYDGGYLPAFPGLDEFQGQILRPMEWPAGDALQDKSVVVIGSGATAVSMVPALAKSAAHVTMLQRSPSYLADIPGREGLFYDAMKTVSPSLAASMTRWKYMFLATATYRMCVAFPEATRKMFIKWMTQKVPGQDPKHFTPRYNPWENRICAVVDGDLFNAINDGRASVVTDRIDRFTAGGVRLASGEELAADAVVMATGFNLQDRFPMSDIDVSVDGVPYEPTQAALYRGLMLSGVPNLSFSFGYINASWTLRADLSAVYVCRLLNHMERNGFGECRPRQPDDSVQLGPGFNGLEAAGYVMRAQHKMPLSGDQVPWKVEQAYVLDRFRTMWSRFDDGVLGFSSGGRGAPAVMSRL